MAVWNRLQGVIFGGAVARAGSDAVSPVLEPVRQHAWGKNTLRVLDPNTAARLVAQAAIDHSEAVDEAKRNGYAANRLNAMVYLAQTAPAVAQAFALHRRGEIGDDDLHHVYAKEQIEPQFWPHLDKLLDELLTPGELAAAIHRGLVPDPGILKGEQPEPPFTVESYPVYPIPTLKEAAAHGFDKDRLGVLVGLQGLPMGVIEAAQAFFRGIITRGDYIRAFNESNNRNEWAASVLEYARQIPTARDFFENALRGYHDLAWAQKEAKRHGMSEADSLVIYQNQGRPMNIRQITQALARGGRFNPEPGELTDPYMASVVEGNVKPGYYDLALSLKYTLPSPFVMRSLTQAGTWSEAKAALRLKESGWIPADADEAAAEWAKGTGGATADPHIAKANNQVWATMHTSYKNGESDATELERGFDLIGATTTGRAGVLERWDYERTLTRKQLTPAQVRKAYTKSETNPATDQPWTRDDAIARLVAQGMSTNDAITFLDQ